MNPRPVIVPNRWRRAARNLAVLGAVASGVGLVGEIASALPPGTPPAGTVTLAPATGTSATEFNLNPPVGAVCPGDNTTGYLFHTFITPLGNDPADFVYSPSGTPSGEPAFTQNLANSIGTRIRNLQPGLGDGLVIPQIGVSFASTAVFGALTPGDYTVGYACTVPDANFVVNTERFWSTTITITASPGAGPNGFTYGPVGGVATTTTTVDPTTTTIAGGTTTIAPTTTTTVAGATTTSSTSTTVVGGTTSTTTGVTTTTNPCPPGGSATTTTTVAGATTTTAAAGTTTTTTAAGGTTTTTAAGATTTTTNPCPTTTTAVGSGAGTTSTTLFAGSFGAGTGGGLGGAGASTSLANTGTSSSTWNILLWGLLLVVFGRMALLTARSIRVTSDRS